MDDLTIEEARKLIEAYAWFWGSLLQRWRTLIEDEYGLDVAVNLESKITHNIGRSIAKRIKKVFGELNGMKGFAKALQYTPEQMVEKNFGLVKLSQKELIVRNTSCTVQKARKKMGKPEYPCKVGALAYMEEFANEINPKLKVTCICCPPDNHPDDISCEWKFEITD